MTDHPSQKLSYTYYGKLRVDENDNPIPYGTPTPLELRMASELEKYDSRAGDAFLQVATLGPEDRKYLKYRDPVEEDFSNIGDYLLWAFEWCDTEIDKKEKMFWSNLYDRICGNRSEIVGKIKAGDVAFNGHVFDEVDAILYNESLEFVELVARTRGEGSKEHEQALDSAHLTFNTLIGN